MGTKKASFLLYFFFTILLLFFFFLSVLTAFLHNFNVFLYHTNVIFLSQIPLYYIPQHLFNTLTCCRDSAFLHILFEQHSKMLSSLRDLSLKPSFLPTFANIFAILPKSPFTYCICQYFDIYSIPTIQGGRISSRA